MDASHYAANLYNLRTAAGLSREDLAQAAGLTMQAIAYIEQGGRRPTLETAVAIAKALGLGVDDFLQPAKTPKRGRGRPRKKAD